jgi:hypothetical protein
MLKIYRHYTNKLLHRFGLEINRRKPTDVLLDLRRHPINPIEAYYRSQGRPFVLNIPLTKCFSIDFSGANTNNPFVKTLLAYEKGACNAYRESPLMDFYEKWQPTHTTYFDKDNREIAPPWDYGLKRSINLTEARLKRKNFQSIRKQLKLTESGIFGHINRGPVSEEFGEITFQRLVKIYNSIKEKGYLPESSLDGHIRACLYVTENDYRVSISCGKHRMAALQALGYQEVPVQFGPPQFPVIIRRDEVDNWPNVRAGYYTREEALSLFDHKFLDAHPSGWR